MDNEKKIKYERKNMEYISLLISAMKALFIPIIGPIYMLIIVIIYDVFIGTGLELFCEPLLFTALIVIPVVVDGIYLLYLAIRIRYIGCKLNKIDSSSSKSDIGEINGNLNVARNVSDLYFLSNMSGVQDTNIGVATNALTSLSILKATTKNKKIVKEYEKKLTKKESNKISFLKLIIYLIPISCTLCICVGTTIVTEINRQYIKNKINSLNEIIANDFSDYNFSNYASSDTLRTKDNMFYITYNNKKASFDLDSDANIKGFSIEILYDINEPLDVNKIKTDLQSLKDELDQSFGDYYKIKDYKNSDIEFNEECIANIKNKVYEIVSIDEYALNIPLRYFKIDNDSEGYISARYSFSVYVD